VITRNRKGVDNYYALVFRVTNYDKDQPDPKNDYRRIAAEKIGLENIALRRWLRVLGQEPDLND